MVIEDVYGFPIVHRRINVLEMVCGEKPPSFIQSSCKPAAPSVFTVQLLTYYLLPIAYFLLPIVCQIYKGFSQCGLILFISLELSY